MTPVFKPCLSRLVIASLFVAALSACKLSVLDELDEGEGSDRDGGLDECVGMQCELCANDELDPLETAIDCGGSLSGCPRCPVGQACKIPSDCASGSCAEGKCSEASCTDLAKNGDETDVDCGGDLCEPCDAELACEEPTDCATGVCTELVCQEARCPDGVQNGTESDVDCGGSCDVKCAPGDRCDVSSDCDGLCVAAACTKPYPSAEPWPVPGLIQAEDFDQGDGVGSFDDTPENLGASDYRTSPVDLDDTGPLEGAVGIAHITANEWLAYTLDVAAAGDDYNLELRAIAGDSAGRMHLELDGAPLGESFEIPAAEGTPTLTIVERNALALPEGNHVLRLVFETPGIVLDWLRVSRGATPFGGTRHAVPGMVQAENFNVGGPEVGYLAGMPRALTSNVYRATDVDLAPGPEAGGFHVTGIRAGDWLDYSVRIAANGTYVLRLNVATDDAAKRVTVQIDGNNVLPQRTLPDTGSFQTFTTLPYPNLTLAEGEHTIRVLFEDGLVNFNWFSIE